MKPSTSKLVGRKKRCDVAPILPDTIKKSKVQAQRKFAQGAGLFGPSTPVKDKEKAKPQPKSTPPTPEPLLTQRVPTTHQFLDFLCFGQTSLLPTGLHFLRDAAIPNSAPSPTPSTPAISPGKKNEKKESDKTGVQALRRKYQEQRLAKEKATSVTKLAKKVKGKNMVRTRSSAVKDKCSIPVKNTVVPIRSEKKVVLGLRSGLNRARNAAVIVKERKKRAKKVKLQRAGLRSGGKPEEPKTLAKEIKQQKKSILGNINSPMKAKAVVFKPKGRKSHLGELGSDFSSDDNEPLLSNKKTRIRVQQVSPLKTRTTRSLENTAMTNELRPGRRTKAASADETSKRSSRVNSNLEAEEHDDSRREKRSEQKKIPKKNTLVRKKLLPKNTIISKTSDDDSTSRRATRSMQGSTRVNLLRPQKKTLIDLMQKKKQKSVRMLTRLRKPVVVNTKLENKQAEKSKTTLKDEIKHETRRKDKFSEKKEIEKTAKKVGKKSIELNQLKNARNTEKVESAQSSAPKRPVRKCSTVDKMWIDVDGFTSDEDDFVDVESIAASAKKVKPSENSTKSKTEDKKEIQNKVVNLANTKKSEAAKDSSKVTSSVKVAEQTSAKKVKVLPDSTTAKSADEVERNPPKKMKTSNDCPPPSSTKVTKQVELDKKTETVKIVRPVPDPKSCKKTFEIDLEKPTKKENASCETDVLKKEEVLPVSQQKCVLPVSSKSADATKLLPPVPNLFEASSSPVENTHYLFASLASSVSMATKPSTLKLDVKSPPAEVKVAARPFLVKDKRPTTNTMTMIEKKNVVNAGSPSSSALTKVDEKVNVDIKPTKDSSDLEAAHLLVKKEINNPQIKSIDRRRSSEKAPAQVLMTENNVKINKAGSNLQCSKFDEIKQKSAAFQSNVTKEKEESRGKLKSKDADRGLKSEWPKVSKITPGRRKKSDCESADNSQDSFDPPVRRVAKRGRRPSPRAEVVTRRERPKRQCSTTGKLFIDRDSDDSTFDEESEEDFMEAIRRSKLSMQEQENRSQRTEVSCSVLDDGGQKPEVEARVQFSDSDDEPLLKKTFSSASPASPMFTEISEGFASSRTVDVKIDVEEKKPPLQPEVGNLDHVPPPSVTFVKMPREPINTHGLDLLSEVVAVADKSNARIEQWLKESQGKGFLGFDESEIRRPIMPIRNSPIPDPILHFVRSPDRPKIVVPEPQKQVPKPASPLKRPVSSVQDLLKLQRERKSSPKPLQTEHSKNCKCNSCVVKKAWFKNKPMPGEPQTAAKDLSPNKAFQALSQAFGDVTVAKASVSVAPIIQNRETNESASDQPPTRKRSFFERMRDRTRKEAMVKPAQSPFSPNNESSVYAFEPETERPLGKPVQRTSSTSTSQEEGGIEEDRSPLHSASIAVQVNMDTSTCTSEPLTLDDGKSIEISTQTEVADDESGQMFYIPLQQSGASTSTEPLIQGVTVKLGTEGPVGPNQKVVMQAKLVTKPPNMPSMKAVVMPQKKDSPKNTPPVGTVQPTTRRPPGQTLSQRPRDSTPPTKTKEAATSNKTDARSATPQVTPVKPLPASEAKSSKETKSNAIKVDQKIDMNMVMEAPTFHLTEKEFQDPMEFFDKIRPIAEKFGICTIVPPSSFKPDCKVADDMRFTAYNQYVHRMLHRWGPSVRETMAMKKYLKTQSISLKTPPCVGGLEVDLPRLYQAVQTCGGLMKVMDRQKWQQVADLLRIPKAAHDRATKLDSIYCQYLLPYDTLKPEERKKLLAEVDADWSAHEEKLGNDEQEEEDEENYIEECEECIVKGRSMALSQFYRIARNTMSMWFKAPEPPAEEVEAEFWRQVTEAKNHVCVHSGSIDSSGWGYGFPVGKNTFARHPWNLKVLTNNTGSVLKSLGPVMGVTVPTLHVGMVFAAFCWYRDPLGLPWIEYLHTGAPKIWYGISDNNSAIFREALTKLLPKQMKDKKIWLPCDTAMPPPSRLTELGVPLSRTTQHPGQFVLVFPRAFTSSLCTGYLVSESVFFARPSWLQTAEQVFRDIHDSAEPSVFSLDNLLISIAADSRVTLEVLQQVLPMLRRIQQREADGRKALKDLGLSSEPLPRETKSRKSKSAEPESQHECEICRASLFLSMVSNSTEETVYCLRHGLEQLMQHKDQIKASKLIYTHEEAEINEIVEKLEGRIDAKVLRKK